MRAVICELVTSGEIVILLHLLLTVVIETGLITLNQLAAFVYDYLEALVVGLQGLAGGLWNRSLVLDTLHIF